MLPHGKYTPIICIFHHESRIIFTLKMHFYDIINKTIHLLNILHKSRITTKNNT